MRSVHLFWVWSLLVFLASTAGFASTCSVWKQPDHESIEVNSIFEGNRNKNYQFQGNLHSNDPAKKIQAISDWLFSTRTFSKMDPASVEVVKQSQVYQPTFQIKIRSVPTYEVRVTDCSETRWLLALNETGIVYPECILGLKQNADPRLAEFHIEKLSDVPYFSRVLEGELVSWDPEFGSEECIQMTALPAGQSLHDLPAAKQEEAYTEVGKRMRIYHEMRWLHVNTFDTTVYYDEKNQRVTFTLNRELTTGGVLKVDIFKLNFFVSSLDEFKKVLSVFPNSNPESSKNVERFRNNQFLLKIRTFFAFARGYLEAWREEGYLDRVRMFGDKCKELNRYYSVWLDEVLSKKKDFSPWMEQMLRGALSDLRECEK